MTSRAHSPLPLSMRRLLTLAVAVLVAAAMLAVSPSGGSSHDR